MSLKKPISRYTVLLVIIIISTTFYYHKNIIQAYNLKILQAEQLDGRLVPHRVNSLEKYDKLRKAGVNSLEVDIIISFSIDKTHLVVGHDTETLKNLLLQSYFMQENYPKPEKIWLDIKNLNAESVELFLEELNRLDAIYKIKDIAIVETSFLSEDINLIAGDGYHLSYYLPTEKIKILLQENNKNILQSKAIELGEWLSRLKVSAVSYDLSLYPFVKEYLEPLLSDKIVYHTWGSIKLWEWDAIGKLKYSACYKDSRVKTILYRYW